MQKFTTLRSIAAPFARDHVDTDMIIPKQFLTTVSRKGLGAGLFYDLRYDDKGAWNSSLLLDKKVYKGAAILVVGDNFGCGSSREHAPWALLDAGYRCLIGAGFADIFYNNCFKNGMLPIVLPKQQVGQLMQAAEAVAYMTVDLPQQTVSVEGTQQVFSFDIDETRKRALLEGLDDIAMTLKEEDSIRAFEERDRTQRPWLWASP
ncbi:MAG: 3-isopropylmalate dehydratase small subunit [Alphaproteobacteria bacterium GM202ARS2]|nr:3-isopropylmalate dehydratase small subunit [Alphaproteobacteria bacterium GM202ARS2]